MHWYILNVFSLIFIIGQEIDLDGSLILILVEMKNPNPPKAS